MDYFENSDSLLFIPAFPHRIQLRDGGVLDTSAPTRTYFVQGELLRVIVVLSGGDDPRLEPASLSLFEQLQFDVFLLNASTDAASAPDADNALPSRVAYRDYGKLVKRLKRVKQEPMPHHAFEQAARVASIATERDVDDAEDTTNNVAASTTTTTTTLSPSISDGGDESKFVRDGMPIRLANGDIAFSVRVPINVEHQYVGQKVQLAVAIARKAPFSVRGQPDVFSPQITYDALLHPKYTDPPMNVLFASAAPVDLVEPLVLTAQREPFEAGGDRLIYAVTARASPQSPPDLQIENINVLIESTRFEARVINDQQLPTRLEPGNVFSFLVEVQPTAVQRVRRNVGMAVPPSTEEATFMLLWRSQIVWRRAASFVRWLLPPPAASPITVRFVLPEIVPRAQNAFAAEVVLTNSSEFDVGAVCELPDGAATASATTDTTAMAAPLVCLDKTLIYERIAPGASMAQKAHFVAVNRGLYKVGELVLRVSTLGAEGGAALNGTWLVDAAETEHVLTTIAVE
jgi:hypothetical protein